MADEWKPTKRRCANCGQLVVGFRNERRVVKLECSHCGLVMVSKRMSRRHERIDIYPPEGEQIEN